jgi:hypothetical protein
VALINASAEVDPVVGHRILYLVSQEIDTRIGDWVIAFHWWYAVDLAARPRQRGGNFCRGCSDSRRKSRPPSFASRHQRQQPHESNSYPNRCHSR